MHTTKFPLPSALRRNARWTRLGPREIPVLLVRPDTDPNRPAPVVLWMHGRTVTKEIDPGRYLRWMRRGIAACAIDLPGHGERHDDALQQPERTFDVVMQMIEEIDGLVDALRERPEFDADRLAIGGMSAGGMATLARLCHPHPFRCASVEATTGSWTHQAGRAMFRERSASDVAAVDPIRNLDGWRDIPFQAIHTRADEWVAYDGQAAFVRALRDRTADPSRIEFITYERTGAPYEHAGFGRLSADAKLRQTDFLARWLDVDP